MKLKICLALLLLTAPLYAANFSLLPWTRACYVDTNGNPLSGGKVYTYQFGTSTPQATYTDSSGTIQNTNPVILDSVGCASIWIGTTAYKIKVTDANDSQQFVVDNVVDAGLAFGITLSTTKLSDPGGTGIVKVTSGTTSLAVLSDLTALGAAPLASPSLTGTPHSTTDGTCNNDPTRIVTEQYNENCFPAVWFQNTNVRVQPNHVVFGSCVLGTSCAPVNLGSGFYTNANSYSCTCTDITAANACWISYGSGSSITIAGTPTDGIRFICVGD